MASIYLNKAEFSGSHPHHPGECPSTNGIWITEWAVGLLRTFKSYFFGQVKLSKTEEIVLKRFRHVLEPTDELRSALKELQSQRPVSSDSVISICEKLRQTHEHVQFVPNFLFRSMSCVLPKRERNLVLIPVVMQSLVDHVVAVVYDASKNRIEVYDSKGCRSRDYTYSVRCNEEDVTLSDVVKRVTSQYGNSATAFKENTEKHQYDSHNCGIYVMDYFVRRSEGKSHEEIISNPLSFKAANEDRRVEFIRKLIF